MPPSRLLTFPSSPVHHITFLPYTLLGITFLYIFLFSAWCCCFYFVFFLFYSQRAAASTEQRVVNSFPPSWYLFLSSECANTRRTHRGLRRLGWKIANEFSTRKVPTKAKRATGKRRRVPWTVLYCYAFLPSYPPDLFLA